MRRFAALYEELDRTTSTDAKVAALKAYFAEAPAEDAAWALYFLAGQKIKRLVGWQALRDWCLARTGLSPWLFDECYATVGDLAETITLLLDGCGDAPEPPPGQEGWNPVPGRCPAQAIGLRAWVEDRLLTLRGRTAAEQRDLVLSWWDGLPRGELLMCIKMLTGAMRIGVARTLVERAISEHAGVSQAVIAHRLMGEWRATPALLQGLMKPDEPGEIEAGRPFPFFLASPVLPAELPAEFSGDETAWVARELGDASAWTAEWKYDGIRAQMIRRGGRVFLWSRGDENLTGRFPEVTTAAARLPRDVVFDGELVCWDRDVGLPLPFGVLQRRIGRHDPGPKILREAPAAFVVYDALEVEGVDLRREPIEARRAAIARVLAGADATLLPAPVLAFSSWAELATLREESRALRVEGVMLKRVGSAYQAGRRRGDWWKWKIEPLTVDAVLTYAQPGHGRRANLLTDYTFAVWDGAEPGTGDLVTVTKAYSGLTDAEFAELDAWIRRHTVERFGPVRRVEPVHVFELAFEGVRRSTRHKSGVAFRFPRMKRWRKDKPVDQADTLAMVWSMIGSDAQNGDEEEASGAADPVFPGT